MVSHITDLDALILPHLIRTNSIDRRKVRSIKHMIVWGKIHNDLFHSFLENVSLSFQVLLYGKYVVSVIFMKHYITKNIHIKKDSKLNEAIKRKYCNTQRYYNILISHAIFLVPLSSHSAIIEEAFLNI